MSGKKKRANYTVHEIETLLELWRDSAIQKKFGMSIRHNVIWEQLAQQMCDFGFQRTPNEVKSKINNLKTEYRKFRSTSGSAAPDWPFYETMHKVLGERDEFVDDSFEKRREIPAPAEVFVTECVYVEDFTPANKRPRLSSSTMNGTGTSGEVNQTEVAEESESQEECAEVVSEGDTPTAPHIEKTKKRISRQSDRKAKEVDSIINFLKASEEKYAQQIDLQNGLLESLIQQEQHANEREDRVAEAFIETMQVIRRVLPTLCPREPYSPASLDE